MLPIRCQIPDIDSAGHRKRFHNSLVILLARLFLSRHAAEYATLRGPYDINFSVMTMCFP